MICSGYLAITIAYCDGQGQPLPWSGAQAIALTATHMKWAYGEQ